MLVVQVFVQVVPQHVAAFEAATEANAAALRKEPGVARFDLVRRLDDPTRYALVEVYDDEAAADAHKQTPHYATWRDTVAPMMAAPRSAERYETVSPDAAGWRA